RALRVSPRRPLSPAWPVLIALGSAAVPGLSMSAWGARVAAFVRSGAGAIWLASLAIAGLLVVFVLPDYLQSAPQAYPVSDGGVIELCTLHAIRKFWYTGPYSQFGWHHPGPLLFYLLAPFYALSNLRTFGLQVGAFAINLASLLTIVLLLLRRATPGVASIG